MSLIKITAFNGMTPRTDPRLLDDNQAQVSVNAKLQTGTLKPYKATSQVAALSKAGTIRSIYRFGEEQTTDANYWFHWTTDVNVVKGPLSDDPYERTYFTGDGVPKMTTNVIATAGGTNYPMNAYILGLPSPASSITVSVTGDAQEGTTAEGRVYVYTYVSTFGEEGPPSAPSNVASVSAGQTVSLSGMSTAPSGNYSVATKRIYRAVTGTGGTDYLFVAEIPVANTTFVDTVTAASLGEVMPSTEWVAPPTTMQGLTMMANGIMAGFNGKDVCFTVPFIPHAWPVSYQLQTEFPIVGIGAFGSSLFVGTTGFPYIITGVDPENMTMSKSEERQSCASKRSIVEMGTGVLFASPDGVCLADGAGVRVITKGIFTRDEWQAYNPSSIMATTIDGRYFAFFDTSTRQGLLVLDFSGDGAVVWESDVYATAAYNDIKTDALYLAIGSNVRKWDAGTTNLTYIWRSKVFVLSEPENMAAAQVLSASYPVTLKVYGDGVLKHTAVVNNSTAIRLPSGYKAREYELEVIGTGAVNTVLMATTTRELKLA